MTQSFDTFLKTKLSRQGNQFTHTRIGDKELKIYGGSYYIRKEDEETFMKHYFEHVFINGNMEYLTEKQLIENSPILIDIDLNYLPNVEKRQHNEDHIIDLMIVYADKCKEILDIDVDAEIEVFVMEKKNVNVLETKTKDGIHIIMGIKMHKALQVILREKVLNEIKDIWDDLPIINTWEDVLDIGVTKGHVNWQLYGSRKPGNQAYLVKHHYTLNNTGEYWEVSENDVVIKDIFEKLSARYAKYPEFPVNNLIKEQFDKEAKQLEKKKPVLKSKAKGPIKITKLNIEDIKNEEILDEMLEELLDISSSCNYILKETHDYTMALPESYYGPGSYLKWLRVGWALASTSEKMFLTWVKFSCREICRDTLKGSNGKFDWNIIGELYDLWQTFEFGKGKVDGNVILTYRSIMYWCKNDALDKYTNIYKNTINYYIEETIKSDSPTEFDLAVVLFNISKDSFVCVSIKNNCWYEFQGHRWFEIDSGNTLRLSISQIMWQLYFNKIHEETNKLQSLEQSDKIYEDTKMKAGKLAAIAHLLKKTTWKANIMKEAKELFYDKDFITKLDDNPYLLCFNNCVIDFKNKIHRRGLPDDYISKCTNIDYFPLAKKHEPIKNEINDFIDSLFPDETLRAYMWEHLASCLVGTNENQTFNIYTGSGRNGKSKLVDLMSKGLGEYKGTVPITLITQKRNSIGSTSSEIVQLMGTRYAVMQEPSKGDTINEGIMKEITGGDPIQGRALFKDTITFVPQFKLVVCTNTLFDIKSNDDGTWRRIRVCDFLSKFLENPYEDEDRFPLEQYPYQYKIDKNIDNKFNEWAPVFMSMLVNKAYELQGNVNDCPIVMQASDKYREEKDYLAQFVRDKIKKNPGSKIKKTELNEEFKLWWDKEDGNKQNRPKPKELHEFMCGRFGAYKERTGWKDVELIQDDDEDDEYLI